MDPSTENQTLSSITEKVTSRFDKKTAMIIAGGVAVGATVGAVAMPLYGFGTSGVAAGSAAAAWQSTIGNVAAGSMFAALQSAGATGAGSAIGSAVGAVAGCTTVVAAKEYIPAAVSKGRESVRPLFDPANIKSAASEVYRWGSKLRGKL